MHHAQGRIILIGGHRYHIQDTHISTSPSALKQLTRSFQSRFIPATAIAWEDGNFSEEDLAGICQQYRQEDDVWCSDFAALIVILRSSAAECRISTRHTICVNNIEAGAPIGPLVIERKTGHIFLVSKLYPDTQFAFFSAIVPLASQRSTFSTFSKQNSVEVAVPSRLYYPKTKSKPLAGLRFGVKDSIALRGLRTGFGSNAWYDTYAPDEVTAPCVQRLLDAGAVAVGKLVASEFCEGVEPAEWVQGVCPFNPRGDGQQKPSSSSTGSAVAVAAYNWLDFTIGTDTGGSIRHPAGVNGLYGQRPTPAKVDLSGVLGATDLFNTVGIFARDAQLFCDVGAHLAGIPKTLGNSTARRKYHLICPTRDLPDCDGIGTGEGRWFPHVNADPTSWTEGEMVVEKLVSRFEAELGCLRTYINIYEFWTATVPKGQPKSLDEATGTIYGDITTSSACASGIDEFLARYRAENDGNEPVMSDVVRARLQYGRTLSDKKIANALESTAMFKQWMETTFFALDDEETTTIIVFPQSHGKPDYRDDKSRWDGNLFIESFSVYALGYLCGCPDYTIPIGELPYHSRVTEQTEYLPVSCSIVGKPGTDGELFDVIEHLNRAGIIGNVRPGKRMFGETISQAEL